MKRDGDVPAGYHVTGNGYRCAHSKIVINNYYGDNNRVIINNSTFVSDDHSKNTVIYAPDNSDNSVSFSNSTTNNNNDKDKDSKDGKDSSSSSSESKDASSSSTSGSSSSASSSTASSSESKASTESSKEKELTDDAFQDKVQSEFEQVYQQKRSGRPAWSFFSHEGDKTGENATAKKDTESTSLYRQGETPKAQDIVDGPKDGAKTEDNAKALAQKIYDVLNSDSKLSDLIKAKYAQIQVSYKGDKWAFNVDVYKEKESSSSSTEKSSESKASSRVERSSSSSSSHTETDSEATFSDLTGDE